MNNATEQIDKIIHLIRHQKIPYAQIKQSFDAVDSTKYGSSYQDWVPDYDYVYQLLIDAVRPYIPATGKILDLGAGTGIVAGKVLQAFDDSHITLVDFSENMLQAAPRTLRNYAGRYAIKVGDFFSSDITFKANSFDCVMSTFALCHGRDTADYQALYQRIHTWLKPSGCFICFDHVIGATDYLTALNIAGWQGLMTKSGLSEASVWKIVNGTYQEDSPLSLKQHMTFLDTAGFTAVDVLWKKHIFAIYAAIKT